MRRLAPGDRLAIATHNPGKLAELDALLRPFGIHTCSAAALGLPEPDETETDFAGNARLKAAAAAASSGLPALADDSGFCVAALNGAPGIFSARWAGPDKNFAAAMELVAARAGGNQDRAAWFVCALCLALPGGDHATFLGRVNGAYVWPPRGSNGFGYDPMFVAAGANLTYGEMTSAQKEADNHRARAFAQFTAACLPLTSLPRADP